MMKKSNKSNKINATNTTIGLFGASFNPPHYGHVEVLKDLVKLAVFDEIWLLPVYSHAFGKALAPFAQRLEMTRLLKDEIASEKISICTIEKDLGKSPSYSYDVVCSLQEKYSNTKFVLILGSDTKQDLPNWHQIDELKKIVEFYFVPRAGFENSLYPDISSTDIRNSLAAGISVAGKIPKSVEDYLKTHRIYFL